MKVKVEIELTNEQLREWDTENVKKYIIHELTKLISNKIVHSDKVSLEEYVLVGGKCYSLSLHILSDKDVQCLLQ